MLSISVKRFFNSYYPTNGFVFARKIWVTAFVFICTIYCVKAQTPKDTSTNTETFTLQQCINYGLQHQPTLQQSLINQSITRATNAINKAGWYPQVAATAGITHYTQLPTNYNSQNGTPTPVQTGIANTSIPGVSVSQAVFSPSLIYASRVAPYYVTQSQQITDSTKINVYVSVSKSFYNLLLTLQQINVLKEDTVRLAQNVRDSYHQYVGGIVDETDYEEATISLNNSLAQLKGANENITPQYAVLKQAMGYPPEKQFNIGFDSAQMTKDIDVDTTESLQFEHRIEYRIYKNDIDIQHQLTDYYHLAALPTVSAFYNYNYEFANSSFGKLYSRGFPYSYGGLTLSVPIFGGFSRVQNVRRSKLEEDYLGWNLVSLKSEIYSEYTSALGNYKSNLYSLHLSDANVALAKRVYFVVTLQYKQGIVPYLNVITAESNLISSQINYLNALFQVQLSKVDLERAMGNIRL